MTFEEFAPIFATLAIQLRAQDADEGTARGYFIALKDLDAELIALAATRAATSLEWFPKTSEWRDLVQAIERERYDFLSAVTRKRRFLGQAPLCGECDDTGWFYSTPTNRYKRCACVELRRLEVLGRRPLPALPAGSDDERELNPTVTAAIHRLASTKGM